MGNKIKFEIHESHLPLWERTDWRYAILMGGRGNGRSGTASRYSISQLMSDDYTRGAIMRAVHSNIRTSCWGELINRLDEDDLRSEFRVGDNDMYLERGRNSIRAHGFKASSGSLTARLKSLAEYNYIWIEEAEEISEEDFIKLDDSLRTTKGRIRVVLTLNSPDKNHWIIRRWFDLLPHPEVKDFYIPKLKPDVKNVLFIPGTMRENLPNLEPETVEIYQNYKKTNPAHYWQMIEGLVPEVAIGRIYSGWQVIEEVPHGARLMGYGLDFGFSEDEDAIVAVYYYDGGYILDEIYYSKNTSYETLAEVCRALKGPVVSDTNEPRMISALRSAGVSIIETDKGANSVRAGIKHVQGLKISYTRSSVNLAAEYNSYTWLVDKDEINLMVEDPKRKNHLMSAVRYFLSKMVRPQNYGKIIPAIPKKKVNPGL